MEVSYKKLWKLLIDKDMKKKDLAAQAGIGLSTIAKMNRRELVSMEVMMKICSSLDCDIGEVLEFKRINAPNQAANA